MNKKKNQKGFTLVELIVVLVILAVLAAILVPALLGWIDKAKEKKYLLEARNVVMAAQTIATTDYATGTFESTNASYDAKFLKTYESEILDMADASNNSHIKDLQFTVKDGILIAIINKLEYLLEDGTTIIYDRDASPVYQIGEESGAPTYDKNRLSAVTDYLAKLNKPINTGNIREVWKKLYGNSYPTLVTSEKKLLSPQLDGVKGLDEKAINSLRWRPVAYGKSEKKIIMIASSGENLDNGIMAYMVYYNGDYYSCLSNYGTVKFDSNAVYDDIGKTDFSTAKDLNYYSTPDGQKDIPEKGKVWVKLT